MSECQIGRFAGITGRRIIFSKALLKILYLRALEKAPYGLAEG